MLSGRKSPAPAKRLYHGYRPMKELIERILEESARLREAFFRENRADIETAAEKIASAMGDGRKLLLLGNGGSAADAQHIAAEFVNRFLLDRRALPAIALTTDTSILTSVANDSDYRYVFSRQVEALGARGDMLLALSTSGNSPNVLRAVERARELGLVTIGLTGNGGGALAGRVNHWIGVPSDHTPRIQEAQLVVEHLFLQFRE